jgi:hypothetical protein
MNLRKLIGSEVVYELKVEPEDTPVRGNAMASGDDAFDKECEDRIINDINSGNVWAWCCVTVTASSRGVEARDTLGCCSYESEEDFKACPYYAAMKEAALEMLLEALNNKLKETLTLLLLLTEGEGVDEKSI